MFPPAEQIPAERFSAEKCSPKNVYPKNRFIGDQGTLLKKKKCNLIDIREINELENTGKVEGATHIPRGMLEVYLDPNSPAIHNGQLDLNKEFVLFCAGGVRSALAVKSLKEMGYEKISHIDGGFAAMSNSSFKII